MTGKDAATEVPGKFVVSGDSVAEAAAASSSRGLAPWRIEDDQGGVYFPPFEEKPLSRLETDPDTGAMVVACLIPLIGLAIATIRFGTARQGGGRILAASLLGVFIWFMVLVGLPAMWTEAVNSGMRR